MTCCKNTEAKYEQTIVYNSKAQEEIISRPGLYSPHANVMKMSDCVCGIYDYIEVNTNITTPQSKHIEIDLCIQIDDLLPFSGMMYYPRCACGELEIEIAGTLMQNMVFCPIPHEVAMEHEGIRIEDPQVAGYVNTQNRFDSYLKFTERVTDFRFNQCGDFAKISFPFISQLPVENNVDDHDLQVGLINNAYVTINPSSIKIREAKSYIHGFNVVDSCVQALKQMVANEGLIIRGQWNEWYALAQTPSATQIRCNIQVPMSNVSQLIFTFPNSSNQLTVSRNPHLESIQCHVQDRIIPDKSISTLDRAHSEMILNALGLDTLFSASKELIESLTKNRGKVGDWSLMKRSDDMYMLVINLERGGSGVIDGMSGLNVPINLNGNFINSNQNPHYYQISNTDGTTIKHCPFNINMFVLSDAYWKFGPNGGEYIINESLE